MLKLIKYDLKSILKTIVPLWITILVVAAILGLQTIFNIQSLDQDHFNAFWLVLSIVLFALFIAILVISIMFIVQRFWNGLLKEEGYLMFTLPVKPRTLIFSKLISSLIITICSSLIALAAISILAISAYGGVSLLDANAAAEIYNGFTFGISSINFEAGSFFMALFTGLISLVSAIYRIYAAMAVGQLSNKNRFLVSFIAYIVLGVIISSLSGSVTLMTTNGISQSIVLIMGVLEIIAYHIITEYILTNKLNLE